MRYVFCIVLFLLMVSILLNTGMSIAQEPGVLHVVQPGENLLRIALRYGVSLQDLARVNGITNPDRIFAGQVLIIPSSNSQTTPLQQSFAGLPAVQSPLDLYNPPPGSPLDNECNVGGSMFLHCINDELWICGWMLARYNHGIISYAQIRPEHCRPPPGEPSPPPTPTPVPVEN